MKTYGYLLAILISIHYCHTAHAGFLSWLKNCDNQCTQAKLCSDANAAAWCENNCKSKVDSNGKAYVTSCTINRTGVTVNNPDTANLTNVINFCTGGLKEIVSLKQVTLNVIKQRYNKDSLSPEIKYIESMQNAIQLLITRQNAHINSLMKQGANPQSLQTEIQAFKNQCALSINAVTDFTFWAQGRVPSGGFTTVNNNAPKQDINNIFTKRMTQ